MDTRNLVSRKELIQEMVNIGVKHTAASGRLTRVQDKLKGEIELIHDETPGNRLWFKKNDAEKIRKKLGLIEDDPPRKDVHAEEEQENKSNRDETTPASPKDIKSLAEKPGPKNPEKKKSAKPEKPKKPAEQAWYAKIPQWIWFAAGMVVLGVAAWQVSRWARKKKSEKSSKDKPNPKSESPQLADKYKLYD